MVPNLYHNNNVKGKVISTNVDNCLYQGDPVNNVNVKEKVISTYVDRTPRGNGLCGNVKG